MEAQLKSLLDQAELLREGLSEVSAKANNLNYNQAGIQKNAETIKKCVRMIGNNKVAALAARDKRKVMAELEEAADQLLELLGGQ